ncbi:MAG: hypothetical protein JO290_12910 [Sphingomonadaceae bacterium]|nr:hypothetical protein [Sphingomonadaceae bacterium]
MTMLAERAVKTADIGTTILLRSGSYFDYADPAGSDFTIEDIAVGLSRCARFAGQTATFYSVAEHSVWVSRLVPPRLALAGLMHDASEAFTGDMPSPLKRLCPEFKLIEHRVMMAVADRFGFGWPEDPEVKAADLVMLSTEHRALRSPEIAATWLADRPVADIRIDCLPDVEAERRFLERFDELRG